MTETKPVSKSETVQKETSAFSSMYRLIREELPPYIKTLSIAAIFMLVAAACTALTAYMIDPAIKKIFLEKDQTLLLTLPAIIIGVSVARGAATYGQAMIMGRVGQCVVTSLQKKMFDALLRADISWVRGKNPGVLISGFVNDAAQLRDAAVSVVAVAVKEVFTLLGCAAVMFYQDWRLASVTLFIVLPGVLGIKYFTKATRKASHAAFSETGALSGLVSETLTGMPVVHIYGREGYEAKRAGQSMDRRLKYLVRSVRSRAASGPLTEALTGVGVAAAIYYAGVGAVSGKMDINNFMAFLAAMMMAYQPGRVIAGLITNLQPAVAAAERVYEVIDIKPTILSPLNPLPLKDVKGKIEFKNVSFAYAPDAVILENLNLIAQPGEKIALVGLSGAGKSTLMNLIPRFFDVTGGEVQLDNKNIKHLKLEDLRSQIAMVGQDPFIFDGTIYENIAYGREGANEADIIQAAENAAADEFIRKLPAQYQTRTGPNGSFLSGGQKQRIAIARAFVKEAPILLLDEATSALDPENEAKVRLALSALTKGRTAFIIAHRLATVADADRIIVLKDGAIIEDGTHERLLARGGVYASLYDGKLNVNADQELFSER